MRKYNLLEGKEAKFARFGCNFQEKLIRNAFLNETQNVSMMFPALAWADCFVDGVVLSFQFDK